MNTETLKTLRTEYKEFQYQTKILLRRIAVMELKRRNPELEEIGSSDVSIALYDLRKELGSWEEVMHYGRTQYGIS